MDAFGSNSRFSVRNDNQDDTQPGHKNSQHLGHRTRIQRLVPERRESVDLRRAYIIENGKTEKKNPDFHFFDEFLHFTTSSIHKTNAIL
jgi:hypothetical protein